ncbi:MAG: ATP-binding protein [Candidatus Woesearchaeota archaeon]
MEDILRLLNPWWKTGNIKKVLTKDFKRDLFTELAGSIKKKQITTLYGLRRTGKSTLLFQLIEYLIKKRISPDRIIYFSFDHKALELKEIFSAYTNLNDKKIEKGEYYVFLDEIQKLEDWQNKIKIFYDMYPNIKFFVSGSSNLEITKKASESLAGRIQLLKLEPLSFREWLQINKINIPLNKIKLYEEELKQNFKLYIKTPFPEIADLKEEILIRKYLDDFIISRIISYDMKQEFEGVDVSLLETLKEIFFEEPGYILNVDKLARNLNRGKEILFRHIDYLKQGRLIKLVGNFRKGKLSSSRKLKRVYPYHPCFCYGIDEGKLIESLFVSLFDAKHYWREKEKEVDIILKGIPIEIKYRKSISESDIKNVTYFMEHFNQDKGIIITKELDEKKGKIQFIPAWKAALLPLD